MDDFLSNRESLSRDESMDTSTNFGSDDAAETGALRNFDQQNQVLHEGDEETPRVETVMVDGVVERIIIEMPNGKRLELTCQY